MFQKQPSTVRLETVLPGRQQGAPSRYKAPLCLTANSDCSLSVLLTRSCSCCRVRGRFADNRYSLAAASLGVTTATFMGSTEPSADMSNTKETLEPRLEERRDGDEDDAETNAVTSS